MNAYRKIRAYVKGMCIVRKDFMQIVIGHFADIKHVMFLKDAFFGNISGQDQREMINSLQNIYSLYAADIRICEPEKFFSVVRLIIRYKLFVPQNE